MRSITFSSEDLSDRFDDRARIAAWQDFLAETYGPTEVSGLPDRSFKQRLRGSRFDDGPIPVDVLRFCGSIGRMWWTTRGQSTPRATHFVLCFNRRPAPISFTQLGREAVLDSETAVIASCTEPGEFCPADLHDFLALAVDQARLRELVEQVEDLVVRPLPNSPALRHLRRYLEIIPGWEDTADEPDLLAHIGTTLTDLAVLARMRGLRAARRHEIVKEIRARFADPEFSAQKLAEHMGVTDRYVQDLLHESGPTFSQRVLELRLQHARAMLEDCRHDRLKVGEIANASGFNEIPYFNRCFRQRFGTTPTQFRGRQQFR
jgi:AraC-like DNA-binding protein